MNLVLEKSFEFSRSLFQYVRKQPYQAFLRHVYLQLLKSGTSIGANLEEAQGTSSVKDFYYRNSVAYREARETRYWLRLLISESNAENKPELAGLLRQCEALIRIIGKIQSSTRKKMS